MVDQQSKITNDLKMVPSLWGNTEIKPNQLNSLIRLEFRYFDDCSSGIPGKIDHVSLTVFFRDPLVTTGTTAPGGGVSPGGTTAGTTGTTGTVVYLGTFQIENSQDF